MFLHERQSAWLLGLKAALRHFGGPPREVLVDNVRALVGEHDVLTRKVRFNERLLPLLGRGAASLRAVPRTHQWQG